MPIDMFATRAMLRMLSEAKPAETFLRDRYFADERSFDTAFVDIDIWKGKRRVAPYVHPRIGGKTVERQGYRTETYEPPEVSPDMVTTAEDLMNRAPGETIYGAMSPMERAADQLGRDMAELDDMITRREEVQAAQALFTGEVVVQGEGYDEVVRYWPTNPADQPYLELSAGSYWNEATSDPLADLRWADRSIKQDSGVNPIDVILGQNVADALLNNEGFAKKLDNRRIDLGQIDPQQLPGGVTYYGFIKELGLDLWGYDEWYEDESGEEQPMVPVDKLLVGSPNVRTTMAHGMVALYGGGREAPELVAAPRVPDSWTQRKNPAGRIVQIKSKPLAIIHQIGGFRVIKALA